MGLFFAVLISLSFTANPMPVNAPAETEFSSPEIVLHLKSPLISGNSVKLGYEIPYPGYIEFHLFDANGEKIWHNFGVREKGEHYQALRADKLDAGVTYSYEFWYKGKPYPGKFTI